MSIIRGNQIAKLKTTEAPTHLPCYNLYYSYDRTESISFYVSCGLSLFLFYLSSQKKTKKHLEKCKRKTEKLLKGSADKIEEIKARPFGIVDEENSEMTEDSNDKPEDEESETQVSFKEGSEHSKSDHTIKDSKSIELNAAELASSLSKLQAEKAPNPDIKHGHLKVQNISETGPQPVGVKIITTEATKLDLEVGDLKIN